MTLRQGNTPGDTGQPDKFYLLVDGVDGGSRDEGHVGWFEIDSYDIDLQHLPSGSGGGGGSGKTEFSPLTVELALSDGLTELLARTASGAALLFGQVNDELADGLVALAESWRPDLVLYEPFAVAGALAAARLDVPIAIDG